MAVVISIVSSAISLILLFPLTLLIVKTNTREEIPVQIRKGYYISSFRIIGGIIVLNVIGGLLIQLCTPGQPLITSLTNTIGELMGILLRSSLCLVLLLVSYKKKFKE